ncbi:unnamed protein product [Calypogeia fissa]
MIHSFNSQPRAPADLVAAIWKLLTLIDFSTPAGSDPNREEKLVELTKNLHVMKLLLCGNNDVEPRTQPFPHLCAQLIQALFRGNTIRLMIQCVPNLNLEARKNTAQVLAYLQRQSVHSRLTAGDYLEQNKDLLDLVISGYEDPDIALHYGTVLRVSMRHQSVAHFLLDSGSWRRLLTYINLPDVGVASDALATFENLMTTHKSTVAEYLTDNYDSFFDEYNSKLLKSPIHFTRWQAPSLLGTILLEKSHTSLMLRYISFKQNLIAIMELIRDPSRQIRVAAFHVFKLFVLNSNKPKDIEYILLLNREKLLRFLSYLSTGTEDEQFKQDTVRVARELNTLISS